MWMTVVRFSEILANREYLSEEIRWRKNGETGWEGKEDAEK